MSKIDLDSRLDRLAARVHSPHGKLADHDALYAELKSRLKPSEIRVVPLRRPFMQRFGRWGIAASLLLVVSLGIAGVAAFEWLNGDEPASATTDENMSVNAVPSPQVMKFERMALADIAQRLSVAYGVTIAVDGDELAQYQVTATFASDEPLDEVLSALCVAADCHWFQTGGRYVLAK